MMLRGFATCLRFMPFRYAHAAATLFFWLFDAAADVASAEMLLVELFSLLC